MYTHGMTRSLFLLLAMFLLAPFAQSQEAPGALPKTPTTRILCIGHLTAPRAAAVKLLPDEVHQTVQLFLDGKIDQWYSRNDQNGVVFILNVTTVDEAKQLLESMPLGKAKILVFDYIPVGPLAPLAFLLKDGAPPAK